MKLIIAVIQDEYMTKVNKALMENKIRITKLTSSGGFLKAGNTTVFIGVEDQEVDNVIEMIKNECTKTKTKSNNSDIKPMAANLFIMDIDQFIRI